MCNNLTRFIRNSIHNVDVLIRMGDGNAVQVTKAGRTHIGPLEIEALFVPQFRISLISVSKLAETNLQTTCNQSGCTIANTNGRIILTAKQRHGLYLTPNQFENASAMATTRSQASKETSANTPPSAPSAPSAPEAPEAPVYEIPYARTKDKVQSDSLHLWHRRFAHMNTAALRQLLDATTHLTDDHDPTCDICLKSKQQKITRTKAIRSKIPFELIHSDTCGPISPSTGRSSHYILFIDDCTRHTEVYFLFTKTAEEVSSKFEHFKAWVTTQGYKIKRFRCDNGRGEYSNNTFQKLLGDSGITFEPSPPYTQHKNGVSERMIRTLNTKARSMLLDAALPKRFWAEAISTAVYLHRRSPSNSLEGSTPYEQLTGSKPKLHHLRRFGCTVYKHIPKHRSNGKRISFGLLSQKSSALLFEKSFTTIFSEALSKRSTELRR